MKMRSKSFTLLFILALLSGLRCAGAQPAAPREDDVSDRLGPRFSSLAAGLSFRPPAGGVEKRRMGVGTEIVQYGSVEEKWALKVTHLVFDEPTRLRPAADDPAARPGILDEIVRQLRSQNATAQLLRKDVVNVGPRDVGLVVSRYSQGAQTWLRQQAFVQATPRNYYVLDFTTPSGRALTDTANDSDPAEAMAVAVFSAMLDTVQVLDQRPVQEDRDQRLFRTRTLLMNLPQRLQAAVAPEQYLRIQRNGKDVGWSYVLEEVVQREGRTGILLSLLQHGAVAASDADAKSAASVVDTAAEMFCSLDKSAAEAWITVNTILKDGKKEETSEIGESFRRVKRLIDDKPGVLEDAADDPRNPQVRRSEIYALKVNQVNTLGSKQYTRYLPPFYLPQVFGAMIPRALPPEPKSYLFATWVGAERELIYRYLDVEPQREVTLAGRKLLAIPIKDRIGLEGDPTWHYLSPDGKYLGSATPSSGFTVTPSDPQALSRIYPGAVFQRPKLLLSPSVTPAHAGNPPAPDPRAPRGPQPAPSPRD